MSLETGLSGRRGGYETAEGLDAADEASGDVCSIMRVEVVEAQIAIDGGVGWHPIDDGLPSGFVTVAA